MFENLQPFNHVHQFWAFGGCFVVVFCCFCFLVSICACTVLIITESQLIMDRIWLSSVVDNKKSLAPGRTILKMEMWLFYFFLQTLWCLLLICYRSMFVAPSGKLLFPENSLALDTNRQSAGVRQKLQWRLKAWVHLPTALGWAGGYAAGALQRERSPALPAP